VTLWYGSADRDEDVFADPDTFDVTREPNDHVAFGLGAHFCLGAGLARLEIRVLLEELLARVESASLAGPPLRLRSNIFTGLERLPVAFDVTSARSEPA
jgi:cytochrome P450